MIFAEGFLHRVQRVAVGKALDRGDVFAVDLAGEDRAGFDRQTVNMNGAGAALGRIAADMGAGHAQTFAQILNQKRTVLSFR